MTFVYESAWNLNKVGIAYWDVNLLNMEPGSMVEVWRKVSLYTNTHTNGCLHSGDSTTLSVPSGKTLMFYLTTTGSSTYTWWSAISDNLQNVDMDPATNLKNPHHFGWVKLQELGSIVFSAEDGYNLGDKDFNDVIFSLSILGNWATTVPSYSINNGTIYSCKSFDPNLYRQNFRTYDCFIHTIMDETGHSECMAFYKLPKGWSIAPIDTIFTSAVSLFQGVDNVWNTPCAVGVNEKGALVGYKWDTQSNQLTTCDPGYTDQMIDQDGTRCYFAKCPSRMILRKEGYDTTCNILIDNKLCENNNSVTSNPLAPPTTLFINLVPNQPLNLPIPVIIRKSMQIFVLMDPVATKTGDLPALSSTISSLFYMLPSVSVGVGYTTFTCTCYNLVVAVNFVSSVGDFLFTPPTQSLKVSSTPVFQTAYKAITSTSLSWTTKQDTVDITPRVMFIVTKALTIDTTKTSQFISVMKDISTEVWVVICVADVNAVQTYVNFVSQYNIPRTTVVAISWPNPINSDSLWLGIALAGARSVIYNIALRTQSDDIKAVASLPDPTVVTMVTNQTVATYYTNPVVFKLPTITANTALPGTVEIGVSGSSYKVTVYVHYNSPPTTIISPTTFNCIEDQDCVVRLIPASPSLDLNDNLLLIQFISIKALSPFGIRKTWGGPNTVKDVVYPQPTPLPTYAALGLLLHEPYLYGTFSFTYRLFDGCAYSQNATAIVSIASVPHPPSCTSFNTTMLVGQTLLLRWSGYVSDPDSTSLSLYFTSISSGGTLYYYATSVSAGYPYSSDSDFYFTSTTSGKVTFVFYVYDGYKSSPTCTTTVFMQRPDLPPTLTATPQQLVTPPDTVASVQISISDPVLGGYNDFYLRPLKVDFTYIDMMRPSQSVDQRSYDTFDQKMPSNPDVNPFLASLSLQNAGSTSFNFTWKPNKYSPSGATYKLEVWSVDEVQQSSQRVDITFQTPQNVAPVCLPPITSASIKENDLVSQSSYAIRLTATDTVFQRDRLQLSLVLPGKLGKLYDKNNNTLSMGQMLNLSLSSTVAGQNSSYLLYYQPYPYMNGPDSFMIRFTDPENMTCSITVSLNVTAVNNQPQSSDVYGIVLAHQTVEVTISGTDPDTLYDQPPQTISLTVGSLASLKGSLYYNGSAVATTGAVYRGGPNNNYKFNYNSLDNGGYNETFTFFFTDNKGLSSPTYKVVIQVIPVNVPPEVYNVTFTGQEDAPLQFFLDNAFNDIDGSNDRVTLFVKTLPTGLGQFLGKDTSTVVKTGAPLARDSQNRLSMTFIPLPDWYGQVQFLFYAMDIKCAQSKDGMVTLVINSVDDPPVIALSDTSLTVGRMQNGTLSIVVSDIDSTTVSIVFKSNTIPLLNSSVYIGTAQGNAVRAVTTIVNNQPLVTLNTNLLVFWGSTFQASVPFIWSPNWDIAEGTSSYFIASAIDSELTFSVTSPQAYLWVSPNKAPFVVPGAYSITILEDSQNAVNFVLIGSDPDVYHQGILNIVVVSLQSDLPLLSSSSTPVSPNVGLPTQSTTNTTYATVTVQNRLNWNGRYAFSFQVFDVNRPIPGRSEVKEVELVVLPVNDPPVSQNVTLVVDENSCTLLCATGWSAPSVSGPFTTITATDVDSTQLSLIFLQLPSCVNGALGYKGTRYASLSLLDKLDSTTAPFPNSLSWDFWYQPPPNAHSQCSGVAGNWICNDFLLVPFVVSDGQSNSSVYYMHIEIQPSPAPPSPLEYYCNEDTPCPVLLITPVSQDTYPTVNLLLNSLSSYDQFQSIVALNGSQSGTAVPFPQPTPPTSYATAGLTLLGKENVYGNYTLSFQATDECYVSPHNLANVYILPINDPPTCSDVIITVEEKYYGNIVFNDSTVKDVETAFTNLFFSLKSLTLTTNGNIEYDTGGGTWSAAPTNTPLPTSTPLRFYAKSQGQISFQFSAYDGTLYSAQTCSLVVNVTPHDYPPVVSVNPPLVITPPNTQGWATVMVSDPVQGDVTNVYVNASLVASWSMIDQLRFDSSVDSRPYDKLPSVAPSDPQNTPFLPNVPLTKGPVPGQVSFNITWIPNKLHPSSSPVYVLLVWAVDGRNQKSNVVSVQFTTPPNVAPVCLSTIVSTTFDEINATNTVVYAVPVSGTDTLYQRNRLVLKILSLPKLGMLEDKLGHSLSTGQTLDLKLSVSVGGGSDNTTYPLQYQPYPYQNGQDNFTACFIDPEGLPSSSCLTSITLQPVNDPPSSSDVKLYLQSSSSVIFTISGTDPDMFYGMELQTISIKLFMPSTPLEGTLTSLQQDGTLFDGMTINCSACKFNYTSPAVAVNESFYFVFVDSKGLSSPQYTTSITVYYVAPPNQPPVLYNKTFVGSEDNPLKFTLDSIYMDPNGDEVLLKVTSLPDVGQLFNPPAQVVLETVLARDANGNVSLTFNSPPNWFGTVVFTVSAMDSHMAQSLEDGYVTLVVGSVNDPPTIAVSDTSMTVGRTLNGTVTITVTDVDSDYIYVSTSSHSIPAQSSAYLGGSLLSAFVNDSHLYTFTTGLTVRWGNVFRSSVPFAWSPDWDIAEGTTGNVVFYAIDSDSDPSADSYAVWLNVKPNNAPFVVQGDYNVTVNEDEWTTMPFDLIGSDPDVYHQTRLNVVITLRHDDLPFYEGGTAITSNGYRLVNTTHTINTTVGRASVQNVADWNGRYTFSFQVFDVNQPMPAQSEVKEVNLNVLPVNDPPTSQDVTLIVDENACPLLCPTGPSVPSSGAPFVTITARDVDSTNLTLFFLELPSCSEGALAYEGTRYASFSLLDKLTSTATLFLNTRQWDFWYQPPPNTLSSVCNGSQGNWVCNDYLALPFVVSDGQSNSSVYYMHIKIQPTSSAPVSLEYTCYEDTPCVVSLITPPPSAQDPYPTALQFVSLSEPQRFQSITTYLGVQADVAVVFPQPSQPTPYVTTGLVLLGNDNMNGNFTLDFRATTDPCYVSPPAVAKVYVLPVNDPPTCVNVRLTVEETFYNNITFNQDTISDIDTPFESLSIVLKNLALTTNGNIEYENSGSWVVVPTNTPLLASTTWFRFYAKAKGSISFQYSAFDGALYSAQSCSIFVEVTPKDNPPIVSVVPAKVVTSPDTEGYATVTVSDPVQGDLTNLYLVPTSVYWLVVDTLRLDYNLDPRPYALLSSFLPQDPTATPFLANVSLQKGPVSGQVSFNITWVPDKLHPSSSPVHTLTLWAVDGRNQASNEVTVQFTTPDNVAPECLGTIDPTTFPETNDTLQSYVISVIGTDTANQRDRLVLKVSSLPLLGALRDSKGNALTSGQTLEAAQQPGNNSVYPLTYEPYLYYSGDDSFTVFFVDPEGATSSPCPIALNITWVNHPPTSSNASATLPSYSSVDIVLTAFDVDTIFNRPPQNLSMELVSVSGLVGRLTRYVDNNTVLTNGTVITDEDYRFVYTSLHYGEAFQEQWTFRVFDNFGLYSGVYFVDVTVTYRPPPNTPPRVSNATFRGKEDEPLLFSFDGLYNDTEGPLDKIDLFVRALPKGGGQLYVGNPPSSVSENIPLMRNSTGGYELQFIAPSNWYGTATFDIYAKDQQGETSTSDGTITLIVDSVNDPPLITVSPSRLQPPVPRTENGSFVVTVVDLDSATVSIVLSQNTISFQFSTLVFGNHTYVTDASINQTLETFNTGIVDPLALPFRGSTVVTWSPFWNCPDDVLDSFSVFARDSDGGISATESGWVSVNPNNPPTVVFDTSAYTKNVTEDQWTTVSFVLTGTDLDWYHANRLAIVIDTFQPTLPIVASNGTRLGSLPFSLPTEAPTSSDGNTTTAVVTVSNVKDYSGEFWFTFIVQDVNAPVPGTSTSQKVLLIVDSVNDPPVSSSLNVTILENTCIAQCLNRLSPDQVNHATIKATDVDSLSLQLKITNLPQTGKILYKGTDFVQNGLLSLASADTLYSPPWDFWFQPNQYEHSPGCNITSNETCQPYATLSFVINDGEVDSDVYNVFYYVLPVDLPPHARDETVHMVEDTVLRLSLDYLVWDDDGTPEALRVYTDGYEDLTKGTLTDLDGVALLFRDEMVLLNNTIVYMPPLHTFSFTDPMAMFHFHSKDEYGLISDQKVVIVYVDGVKHTVEYIGDLQQEILEDSFAEIFVGRRDIDWKSVDPGEAEMNITSLSSVGTWQVCTVNALGLGVQQQCSVVTPQSVPIVVSPRYRLKFFPLPDDNGPNYANLTFTLKILAPYPTDSYLFNYTINVTPVNDPPVIRAQFNTSRGVECDEDTYLTFSFNVTDIDSPLSSITLQVLSGLGDLPSDLYLCTTKSANCSDGYHVSDLSPINIHHNNTPTWRMGFIPKPDKNGKTRLSVTAFDDYMSYAVNSLMVKITVWPINDPPFFTVTMESDTTSGSDVLPEESPYSFSFGPIIDIDMLNPTMRATFTTDHGYFGFAHNASLPICNFTSNSSQPQQRLVCQADKFTLKSTLKKVLYYASWQTSPDPVVVSANTSLYRNVTVVINDLANVDKLKPLNAMEHEESLNVTGVFSPAPPSVVVDRAKQGENIVSIAVGLGLLFAVIAGALAAFFMAKSKKDVDNYLVEFLSQGAEDSTTVSPFYVPATKSVVSPIFKGGNVTTANDTYNQF